MINDMLCRNMRLQGAGAHFCVDGGLEAIRVAAVRMDGSSKCVKSKTCFVAIAMERQ